MCLGEAKNLGKAQIMAERIRLPEAVPQERDAVDNGLVCELAISVAVNPSERTKRKICPPFNDRA